MIKQISVHSLQEEGYTEDNKSLRRFERRYGLFSVGGVVLFFYGSYLMANQQEALGLKSSLFGSIMITCVCMHCAKSTPRSLNSGELMERYRRSDCDSGIVEYVYVDPSSKTFCSRIAMGYSRTGIFKPAEQDSGGNGGERP